MTESGTQPWRRRKLLGTLLAGDLIVMAVAAGALIWPGELSRFGTTSTAPHDLARAASWQDTSDSAATKGLVVGRAAPDFLL